MADMHGSQYTGGKSIMELEKAWENKQAGMIGGTEAPGSMCSVNG
jgi:hypothetical protein